MSTAKQLTSEHLKALMPDLLVDMGYVTDFDACLTPGVYSCITPNAIGLPDGANPYGILIIMASVRYGIQIYSSRERRTYIRTFLALDKGGPDFALWTQLLT